MSTDGELVARYLDGEMSGVEAAHFRARLAHEPALGDELAELRGVGAVIRLWARDAERRAGPLLEPTLSRVAKYERARARGLAARVAVAVVLLALTPLASQPTPSGTERPRGSAEAGISTPSRGSAAVERLDSGVEHATVFVVGSNRTTVVWLSDEAEAVASPEPGPG